MSDNEAAKTPTLRQVLADGVVTGAAATALIVAACAFLGHPLEPCSELIFLAGGGAIV